MAKKDVKKNDLNLLDDAQKAYLGRIEELVRNDKDFRALLLRVQEKGKNYVGQSSRIENKDYDPKFVEMLEEGFSHIDAIIAKPRSFIKEDPTVMDAGRAKKINAQTVVHLASHTQFVYDIDKKTGDVTPMKLLSIESDVDYGIYENRFVMTLIRKCAIFIERRVNYIKDHGETRDSDLLLLHTETDVDGARYEVDSRIKVSTPSLDEGKAEQNEDLLNRLYSLRERCSYYMRSPFMELMKGQKEVANPIHMTNMIVKQPDYKACYTLWQFLDNYLDLGVRYNVTETEQTYDDEYFEAIYGILVAEMLTLRSRIVKDKVIENEKKKKTKRIVPKVLFTLEDETYYNGKFLYDAYPEARPDPDTPLMPTPEECKKERERLENKRKEDLIRKALIDAAIEEQKRKDIVEEANRRKEKEEEEERLQRERMRLAALEEERRRAEEERLKALEREKRKQEENEELARLRARIRREAELDKLGYRAKDFPHHEEDGYLSPEIAEGSMPNFVSPTLPFDQILASFLEEEERKAREKREAEENAKRERIENAIKEEKRKNLAALGYHEEDFPSHFEDGGNALEAPSGLTPNFASPSKDLGALIEKEEIKPVEETKPLAKEGVPTEVVAPSARIEGPIGGEGTGTPVPVPYQEAPSAPAEFMAHALLAPNGPTPDFESPYKDLRNIVAMADLPPFEEQQPEEIQEDNIPIEESVEEEKSGFTGITRLSFAEKLAKADEELYRMYQEIHDHILLYEVEITPSDKGENVYKGRKKIILLTIAGRHIRLNLDLPIEQYSDTAIPLTHTKGRLGESLPLDFRIRSELGIRRGKMLIDDLMDKYRIGKKPVEVETPAVEESVAPEIEATPAPVIEKPEPLFKPTYIKERPTPNFASPLKEKEQVRVEVRIETKIVEIPVPTPVAPTPEPHIEEKPVPAPIEMPSTGGFNLEIERKSFKEKYQSADEEVKGKIDSLREYLSNYPLSERVSNKGDLYSAHREKLVFITMSRSSIKVSYNLDPEDYKDSTIPVEVNSSAKKSDTPLLFRVKSPLSLRRAYQLIDDTMAKHGLEKAEKPFELLNLLDSPETAAPEIETKEEPTVIEVPVEVPVEEPRIDTGIAPIPGKKEMPVIEKATFQEKYAEIDPDIKAKVDGLREYLATYDLTERVSIKGDLFSAHREKLVFIALSRQHAKVSLALDPADYENGPMPIERNKSGKLADVPLLFRLRSDLSYRRAISLIDELMAKKGIEKLESPKEVTPIEVPSPKEEKPVEVAPISQPIAQPEVKVEPKIVEVSAPTPIVVSEKKEMPVIEKATFQEKYEEMDDDIRQKVEGLRAHLASYDLTERVSIKGDLYSAHREKLVFIALSRQHAKVSLALDPADYENGPMPIERNKSGKLADVPLLFRLRSDLSYRRAISLIDELMAKKGIEKLDTPKEVLPIVNEAKKEKPVKEKPVETPIQKPVEAKVEAPAPIVAPIKKEMPVIEKSTFPEKFAEMDEDLKQKLSTIRYKLAEYDFTERVSIKGDLYSAHRVRYAFITLSRKVIKLSLALDPDDYKDSTIPVERNSGSKFADTPLLFRIRSDLSLKRALQLIEEMAEKHGIDKLETPKEPMEIF